MTGNELFHAEGKPIAFPLLEFWQWSASDLISNATRGRFAEFLVAKALNVADGIRVEWDTYDLRTPSGLKIEVKSGAYLQSWNQLKLSEIRFSIPHTRAWSEDSRKYAPQAVRQADIYVFALLAHKDKATVSALNLDQWHFYVVPAARLNPNAKSISLAALQTLQENAVHWSELADAVLKAS